MEKEKDKENRFQWQPMLEIIIVLVAILGSTIPLYVHTDNKLETALAAIHEQVREIQADMRDFHGRLERQDAEFKAFLMYAHGQENKGK